MLRLILIMVAVGALAAVGAWFAPEGIVQRLLHITVATDVLFLLFMIPLALLQRFSPPPPEDGSGG